MKTILKKGKDDSFMAIYYKLNEQEKQAIYGTVQKWKNECLLDNKSLLWPGEEIWTKENISRFRFIFIDKPDESGDSFDDKLRSQLDNEREGVYKFAIELLFIYYMYPVRRSISYETKVRKLEMIASWKDIELDTTQPIFEGLKIGLGTTGTFFNTNKYFELSFLYWFVEYFKNLPLEVRKSILEEPTELKELAENVREQVGKRVQLQHILLHLLLPNYFERISSWGHKSKIVKAFSHLLIDSDTTDVDQQLYIIREKLSEQYEGDTLDFYETPDIAEQWRESNKDRKTEKPNRDDKLGQSEITNTAPSTSNIPVVNFNIEPTEDDLIFEDREIIMDQVMTALRNGKHIILTGPPGTGKSKLAKAICKMFGVESTMVTASSNWSTYETIGGYRPDKEGNLYFDDGIFLNCVKDKDAQLPINKWLIIDEINRADIDKAFGSLFSVLTGDEITLPYEAKSGHPIILKPQGELSFVAPDDYTYVIPKDWRIIATMNTIDKASLYEMSYAFMRRFAFIPVGIPKDITKDLVQEYLDVWNMGDYPNVETLTAIWKLINRYRKIGPAIIEDIAKHTQENEDFTSALILYVLPQFEGLPINKINEFIHKVIDETDAIINLGYLKSFVEDFFDVGDYE